ncbi:MAG: hypothetical protein ACLFUV_01150 [Methanomassiliicoccales archaeon]
MTDDAMDNMMERKKGPFGSDEGVTSPYFLGQVFYAILGMVVFVLGGAQIILGLSGNELTLGPMVMSGEFMLWRGVILLTAAVIFLQSVRDFREIHQQGRMVIATSMVWIVGVMELFALVTGAIPGDGTWFNTLEGFLGALAPPYIPSVILLPFTLVTLYFIKVERDGRRTTT